MKEGIIEKNIPKIPICRKGKSIMTVKEMKRYALACPTSMGVRITPENRMAVQNSNTFYMQATSAESNVLNVASSLGRECLVLTKFVKDSPVADLIKRQLRARNIRFEGLDVEQGGPWGYRHQFNIADSGFGLRAPRVWNDRAGEVVYPKDIERRFNLTHPTVSGLLQRLESKGFLSCEPDPDDRRYKRIVLTEKAAECQKEIWQHILTIEQTMTAGMQESEIDTLVRLLDLAAKNLDVCVDFDCIKEECKP